MRERSAHPDWRKGGLSPTERLKAHHKTLQIPDDEFESLSTEDLVDRDRADLARSFYCAFVVYGDESGYLGWIWGRTLFFW